MTVDRERFEELSLLAAAGAATEEEEGELDTALLQSRELRTEHACALEAASLMAEALPPRSVPEQSFASIQRRLRASSEAEGAAEDGERPKSNTSPGAEVISLARARRSKRWLGASTVVALAAAATLAWFWRGERERVEALTARVDEARASVVDAQLQTERSERNLTATRRELDMVRSRYARLRAEDVKLTTVSNDAGATCKIFINPEDKRWLLFAYDLPTLPSDKDYQLWFVPQEGAPISGGVLSVQEDGYLGTDVEVPANVDIGQAAISVENKGGVASPTMDQIKLIGPLI